MVASVIAGIIFSIILVLFMNFAFGAVILNLFDRNEDSRDEDSRDEDSGDEDSGDDKVK